MLALILLGLVTTATGTGLTLSPTHQDHCKVDEVLWRQKAVNKMWDERRLMKPTSLKFFKVLGMPHIELYFKDETESRTSNLKHRMAWSLIMWGLIEGHIKQNTRLYEASSGSTALSLAYMARILGLKFTAVLPDSVPLQTIEKIRFYGAEAMKVPTAMMFDKATELAKKNHGFFLNQFANADKAEDYHATDYLKYDSINVMHEIVKQFKAMKKPEPDYFVHTAGTGGMITSVGRYVLKAGLKTKVVLADTQFSIYYDYVIYNQFTKDSGLHSWQGPGIPGAGFGNTGPAVEGVTTSLHRNVIDVAYKIPDLASIAAMHFLNENDLLPDLMPETNQLCCLICGGYATCLHFGAFSCNACAAFFRRTVAMKKSYTCARHGNCVITFRRVRRICAACRLSKCVSVGMQESTVLSLGLTPEKSEKLQAEKHLPKVQKFDHRSNFSVYQNNEWLRRIVLAKQSIEHQRLTMLSPQPSLLYRTCILLDIYKQLRNESRLCQMYLTTTGIMDVAKDIVETNITELIFWWYYFTIMLNTFRSDSIRERKLSLVNHSMIEMSEVSIRAYYATDPRFLKHLDFIAETGSKLWFRIEKLANKIYAIGMTTEEQAFFLLLGMIEAITRQTSDPKMTKIRFKPLLDAVFRSMHLYYRDNFATDCTAERMGQLIMTLPLMNEIYNIANEHLVIKSLCINNSEVVDTGSLQKAFHSECNSA